ncbi:MAG: hypothetical protein AAF432_01850 [Planctomycetota bacterium]
MAVSTSPLFAATDSSVNELRDRVAELETELADMKRADGEQWLTERRADEIRSLVSDVLADADTRASFQGGHTGYYKDGAVIESEDGNFKLKVNGQVQVRYTVNYRDDAPAGVDSTVRGFDNTRTKLIFSGHVHDSSWKYKVSGDFGPLSNGAGTFGLENAYIKKVLGNGNSYVKFGQFKLDFLREENVSAAKQLAADRSLVNDFFTQDYSQGVEWGWHNDNTRFSVAFSDGFGSRNSAALASGAAAAAEYAITGRLDFLLSGDWAQFSDFTSMPGSTDGTAVLIGVAGHYEESASGVGNIPAMEVERFTYTVDGSIEGDGWNAFAAFVGNSLESDAMADVDQYGFVVQGGMFINDSNELFARYEWGDADMAGVEDLSLLTVGINSYYYGHNLKSTVDIGYAFDELTSGGFTTGSLDYVPTAADEDGELVIRGQLQLLF